MPDVLEFLALLIALGGLAAVLAEIWLKEPALFGAIASDVRTLAEPTMERGVHLPTVSTAGLHTPLPANSNHRRHAA